ncbi:outer membrane beta-barrel protein [Flocculibacter collagenilyticus]|uniref:outer membrane beta-barrel protein n=1 Tax=Flocculibacter collagenilyticus TaxID=2744479 RepID=UPI0018F49C0D|nr:hypothetical protein [Flocculibacter collagenilyticus]
MFKRTLLTTLLAVTSFSSSANWVTGVSYISFSQDIEEVTVSADDINMSLLAATLGYKFSVAENFYLIPELRLGTGISDDSLRVLGENVDLEIDSVKSAALKAQYEFSNNIYIFGSYTHASLELSATSTSGFSSYSFTEEGSDSGFGVGAGYNFSEDFALEVSLESYDDDVEFATLSLKYTF